MGINVTSTASDRNARTNPMDDFLGDVISEIELAGHIPTETFDGIPEFSHFEIIYSFDKVEAKDIVFS